MTTATGHEADERIRAQRMDAASCTARVLAHEIANYLGTMRTMLYLLAEEMGPLAKAKEDLKVVERSVDGATKLVEALRAFAHAPPLGRGPADLNAVLREAEPALRALMSPGKTLVLDLATERLPVAGDAPRLAQVVLDLVAGANRNLPVGGRITIATEHAPGQRAGESAARLVVRDDGAGVDPATAARIFEPFVFDVAHDTGLRLPTVYATVTQGGGEITMESAPGAGTAFAVTLPLAPEGARGASR